MSTPTQQEVEDTIMVLAPVVVTIKRVAHKGMLIYDPVDPHAVILEVRKRSIFHMPVRSVSFARAVLLEGTERRAGQKGFLQVAPDRRWRRVKITIKGQHAYIDEAAVRSFLGRTLVQVPEGEEDERTVHLEPRWALQLPPVEGWDDEEDDDR